MISALFVDRPRLADLAGHKAPAYLDGTNLRPVLENPAHPVKPAAFSQVRRGNNGEGYSVRTERFRYTEWSNARGEITAAQLFDEVSDPAEAKNLIAEPAHAATAKELAALLAPIRAQK